MLMEQIAKTSKKETKASRIDPDCIPSSKQPQPMSLISKTFFLYLHLLETHPLTTKTLSSGVVAMSRDDFCRYLEGGNQFDSAHSICFAFLGWAFIGAPLHFWVRRWDGDFWGVRRVQHVRGWLQIRWWRRHCLWWRLCHCWWHWRGGGGGDQEEVG